MIVLLPAAPGRRGNGRCGGSDHKTAPGAALLSRAGAGLTAPPAAGHYPAMRFGIFGSAQARRGGPDVDSDP